MFGKADELLSIDTCRVGKDTTAIDNGNGLVGTQEYLIRTEVSVCKMSVKTSKEQRCKHTRTTSLHFRDVLLPQSKLLVNAKHILTNG